MKTWKTADRSEWSAGEWDDEPDKAHWIDEATDFDCMIVRNWFGALCGYVGVPEGHPLYEKDMTSIWDEETIDCHGGVTFSDFCHPFVDDHGKTDESRGICHIPENGRPEKVWWIGFDCHHLYDKTPSPRIFDEPDSYYRNFNYVKSECESLAKQLKERMNRRG